MGPASPRFWSLFPATLALYTLLSPAEAGPRASSTSRADPTRMTAFATLRTTGRPTQPRPPARRPRVLSLDSLCLQLRSQDLPLRIAAAQQLGQRKDNRAIPALVDALDDSYSSMRRSVIDALHDLACADLNRGTSRDTLPVIPAIAILQHDPDEYVRCAAASLLETIGDRRAVEPLLGVLQTGESNYLRDRAGDCLSGLYDRRAVRPLLEMLGDPNLPSSAVHALEANINAVPGALDTVTSFLNGAFRPARTRIRCGEAIAEACRWGNRSGAAFLMEALRDEQIAIVAGARRFYIRGAIAGSVNRLLEALYQYGDIDMGILTDFLNSREKRLARAAREWASVRGIKIVSTVGTPEAVWGGK